MPHHRCHATDVFEIPRRFGASRPQRLVLYQIPAGRRAAVRSQLATLATAVCPPEPHSPPNRTLATMPARTIVDVLHALHARIERAGNQGVHALAEPMLVSAQCCANIVPKTESRLQPAASTNASTCSAGPLGEVLYNGTTVDLRRRTSAARTYRRRKEYIRFGQHGRPCRMCARAGSRRG